MIKFNKEELKNKIWGCWIGKNIGGTMGAPFEGWRQQLDIPGYTTPKGQPLPNDDLDLQLVWLRAMEQVGPHMLSSNYLAEYWLTYISPHWNEYGISKSNMLNGIMPTLSGELYNDDWKNSNGAWIRSEIWACLNPGVPNAAIKYAIMDASIDHGLREGTFAEIFTAALESIAFVETDRRALIETALTYIPENSRLAECVNLVLKEYDKGTPYRDVRDMLVDMTEDLGWFQAPANVSYAVIGLMYGEGDFEKSLIYTINCGDDTDCSAATCGAILGIMCGADNIPLALKDYIGDRIVTLSINGSYIDRIPKNCTDLTTRVMNLIPSVLNAQGLYMEYTDSETEYDKNQAFSVLNGYSNKFAKRSPYSFEVAHGYHLKAIIEYEKLPLIASGEEFKFKITYEHQLEQTVQADISLSLPEGWDAKYQKNVFMYYHNQTFVRTTTCEYTIVVGENVSRRNDITIHVKTPVNPMTMYIPITLLG